MRFRRAALWIGAPILFGAYALIGDREAQKNGQAPSSTVASPKNAAARADALADDRGTSQPQSIALAMPPVRPNVTNGALAAIEQLGQSPAEETLASRALEEETQRATQAAVEAIPLQRAYGPRILPFPDADGRPIPVREP